MNRHISFSSHREYRFYQGPFASCVANGIQAVNFLGDRFLRKSHLSAGIDELYRHSVNSAFSPKEAFLVTGAPHASAYYPRDFAWFYPDVLDPETIMDSEDAVRRVRLLEKSVRLMLEAVRSNVVTTTIVPAGSDRYIGVNYFSLPSDTLLGILAGLEQIMRADQRTSSYLAMAQGAHAGRLLLAEYRDDLKKAIFQLADALEPFDDNGLTALLCDVTAPRSAATDTRAERRRFVTNACVYATFVRGIRIRGDRPDRAGRAARARALAIQKGAARVVRQAWLYQACPGFQERAGGVFHCARFRQCASGILGSERGGRTRAIRRHDGSDTWRAAVSNPGYISLPGICG